MSVLFTFARLRLRRVAVAGLLTVLTLLAGMALLGVSGWFLTATALAGVGASFNIFTPSSLVRGLSLARIVSRYGERVSGHAATLSILSDLRVFVFSRMIPLVPQRGAALHTGDLVSRLTADIETLDMVFLQALLPIGAALTAALALGVVLGLFLPDALGIGVGGFLVTTLLVPLFLARSGRKAGSAAVAGAAALRTSALDGIDGHGDIVALGIAPAIEKEFALRADTLRQARLAQARRTAIGPMMMQLGAGATMVGVLWVGLGALAEQRIGGPFLVGVLLAVLAAFEASGPVLRGAGRLGAALAASWRLQQVLASTPAVAEPKGPSRLPSGGTLVVDHVRFEIGGRPVLDDLSFTVAPGDRIAIIGESGSGKSTLLSLLVRLDDVSGGSIRLAGLDIRDVATADLHSRIALMTQDAPVFIGTIRDNLQIGSPFADDATLYSGLGHARLDSFVRSLPRGLDTWLGEAGETLSAGQARRLCLARTLLSPAEILLLDEPTAGLDPQTEADFLADIVHVAEGRSLILATHAALPPGSVDRVLRLDAGRLKAV
jgi:ATP-binding cassette, subfamily C, bacterial CydC